MQRGRTHHVADGLLELVLDGTFSPGTTLPSETELAERFGVSRLTVREAIKSLASTNVIDVRQGRSSVINPADKWSPLEPRLLQARGKATGDAMLLPRQLLQARRMVEMAACELAAEHRDDRHITQLDSFLERMQRSHEQTDVPLFVEADLAFHQTLFDAVGNVFLDAIFDPLSAVLRTLRVDTSSVAEIREHAIEWHGKILAAVAEGNAADAREAMRGHLIQTEDDMIRYLADRDLAEVPWRDAP